MTQQEEVERRAREDQERMEARERQDREDQERRDREDLERREQMERQDRDRRRHEATARHAADAEQAHETQQGPTQGETIRAQREAREQAERDREDRDRGGHRGYLEAEGEANARLCSSGASLAFDNWSDASGRSYFAEEQKIRDAHKEVGRFGQEREQTPEEAREDRIQAIMAERPGMSREEAEGRLAFRERFEREDLEREQLQRGMER